MNKEGKKQGFATRQIHAGVAKNAAGSLCDPIYQSATFVFDSTQEGRARFSGQEKGYIYSRQANPSLSVVEEKVASLENAGAALATASGMGAIVAAIYSCVKSGDEIIADETLYGCTYAFFSHGLSQFGIKVHFVDMRNPDNISKLLSDRTKVVYFETPCNPTLKLLDIEVIAEMVHAYNPEICVMVDNTFCSPYLQRPIDFGADTVVHSATKYINGHGDVIAGFVAGSEIFIDRCRNYGIVDMTGAVLSPFNAFLIARGLKTLDIRMERHCANAQKLAEFLENHSAVKKVYYPGLKSFEGYEIAKKQMKLPGGMISFELNADKEKTAQILNELQLCKIAVSLGDAETLVEHAASMTHYTYSAEDLKAAGIAEGLVRVSVGLEDVEDIIADFEQAFGML